MCICEKKLNGGAGSNRGIPEEQSIEQVSEEFRLRSVGCRNCEDVWWLSSVPGDHSGFAFDGDGRRVYSKLLCVCRQDELRTAQP